MSGGYDLIECLNAVVNARGSDLHLTVDMPPLARIDGTLRPIGDHHLTPEESREMIFSILTETQRATLEENWELDFGLQVDDVGRFRGNAHYIKGTVQACFRLISEEVPALESLGHRPTVESLCHLRHGLVLVTGVTGSGKSTTLAAMVERISANRSGVILSIEDPIEYVFKHGECIVKQREVGIDTRSFSNALKFALRQDPDVILVSEMRDLETIRTAITAAETGHLVLSTLHTADAPKTLDRLIDVFPGDQQPQIVTQLANSLQAVVSQRLLPDKSGEGRVLASEVMMINHAVRACIRQGKFEQIPGLLQIGGRDGMHTFDESLAELYSLGKITQEVAKENANRPDELELRMDAPKKKRKLF